MWKRIAVLFLCFVPPVAQSWPDESSEPEVAASSERPDVIFKKFLTDVVLPDLPTYSNTAGTIWDILEMMAGDPDVFQVITAGELPFYELMEGRILASYADAQASLLQRDPVFKQMFAWREENIVSSYLAFMEKRQERRKNPYEAARLLAEAREKYKYYERILAADPSRRREYDHLVNEYVTGQEELASVMHRPVLVTRRDAQAFILYKTVVLQRLITRVRHEFLAQLEELTQPTLESSEVVQITSPANFTTIGENMCAAVSARLASGQYMPHVELQEERLVLMRGKSKAVFKIGAADLAFMTTKLPLGNKSNLRQSIEISRRTVKDILKLQLTFEAMWALDRLYQDLSNPQLGKKTPQAFLQQLRSIETHKNSQPLEFISGRAGDRHIWSLLHPLINTYGFFPSPRDYHWQNLLVFSLILSKGLPEERDALAERLGRPIFHYEKAQISRAIQKLRSPQTSAVTTLAAALQITKDTLLRAVFGGGAYEQEEPRFQNMPAQINMDLKNLSEEDLRDKRGHIIFFVERRGPWAKLWQTVWRGEEFFELPRVEEDAAGLVRYDMEAGTADLKITYTQLHSSPDHGLIPLSTPLGTEMTAADLRLRDGTPASYEILFHPIHEVYFARLLDLKQKDISISYELRYVPRKLASAAQLWLEHTRHTPAEQFRSEFSELELGNLTILARALAERFAKRETLTLNDMKKAFRLGLRYGYVPTPPAEGRGSYGRVTFLTSAQGMLECQCNASQSIGTQLMNAVKSSESPVSFAQRFGFLVKGGAATLASLHSQIASYRVEHGIRRRHRNIDLTPTVEATEQTGAAFVVEATSRRATPLSDSEKKQIENIQKKLQVAAKEIAEVLEEPRRGKENTWLRHIIRTSTDKTDAFLVSMRLAALLQKVLSGRLAVENALRQLTGEHSSGDRQADLASFLAASKEQLESAEAERSEIIKRIKQEKIPRSRWPYYDIATPEGIQAQRYMDRLFSVLHETIKQLENPSTDLLAFAVDQRQSACPAAWTD